MSSKNTTCRVKGSFKKLLQVYFTSYILINCTLAICCRRDEKGNEAENEVVGNVQEVTINSEDDRDMSIAYEDDTIIISDDYQTNAQVSKYLCNNVLLLAYYRLVP